MTSSPLPQIDQHPLSMAGTPQVGARLTFSVGDSEVPGVVRYIGRLDEDPCGEEWIGVELDEPVGRHSGRRYFKCAHHCGLFVKLSTYIQPGLQHRIVMPVRGPLWTEYEAGMQAAAGAQLYTRPAQPIGPGDSLLIIDCQNDFLPGGAFAVSEALDILPAAASLVAVASAAGAAVVCTRDYHPHDHASFRSRGGPFPAHCLQGSRGARIAEPIATALAAARLASSGTTDVAFKGFHRDVDSFGAFPYSESLAAGRLVGSQHDACSMLSWTGASVLTCSAIDEDINA